MKLFIDIETVPTGWFGDERKSKYEEKHGEARWLFAEFSKVVCISVWYEGKEWKLITKSFYWDNEKEILEWFSGVANKQVVFVWHNVKWFDLPFLIKRYLVNRIKVPNGLKFHWKKPWEVEIIDTADLWKSMWRQYTSLDIICKALWIETPKQWIDGSQVAEFYKNWKIEEIKDYCEKDVTAVYELYKVFEEFYI